METLLLNTRAHHGRGGPVHVRERKNRILIGFIRSEFFQLFCRRLAFNRRIIVACQVYILLDVG
jgi:hypothetical protein